MGKRGPKPKGKVRIEWSSDFAYAIGLLVSDGCLSPNGRHIILASVDREQLENFMRALRIVVSIGKVQSPSGKGLRVQFGDVLFYAFLRDIGLMPNKSKIIGAVTIPDEFFFDFLRGSFDGDGSTYAYWDKRWRSSYLFYTAFVSASRLHIDWLQERIETFLGIHGHTTSSRSRSLWQLKYAKKESLILLHRMYKNPRCIHLRRKRLKIEEMLRIVGEKL